MTRLPIPGGDDGRWGQILNEFLTQVHNADGSLKDTSVTKAKLSTNVQTSLDLADNAIPASQKGAEDGVASLTGTTLTPAQIPATVITKSENSADTGKAIDAYTGAPLAVVKIADIDASGGISSYDALRSLDAVSGWGHSMMAAAAGSWIEGLGTAMGISAAFNGGVSGQSSSDIAVRQGGLQPLITVSGNQIPASGTVSVAEIRPSTSYRSDGTGSFSFAGTLAGITGTLVHNMDTDTWSFTRTNSGSVVSCPADTPFYGSQGSSHRRDIQIFWIGRNNLGDSGCNLLDVLRDLDYMIRHLTPKDAKWLVLGEIEQTTEIAGSANYLSITDLNTRMAARYGNRFIDIRRYLIDYGMDHAGLYPTSTDVTNIANDVIPTSLRSDSLHPNAACYAVVADLVRQKIGERGFLPGVLPADPPAQVTGLTASSATSNTQALSWNAIAGATYRIEFRQTGTTEWLWAGASNTNSVTVSGLPADLYAGTSYDYRVKAYTRGGYGTPSATVTASTTGSAPTMLTSDSFDRANTSSGVLGTSDAAYGGVGAAYTATGDMRITSNQVARPSGTFTRYGLLQIPVGPGSRNDMRVDVKMTALGAVGAGPAVRCNGAPDPTSSYYVEVYSNGSLVINKRVSSSDGGVAGPTGTGVVSTGDVVGLKVAGSTLTAYVNNVPVLTATNSQVTAGEYGGMRYRSTETSATMDNLKIYDK